MPLGIPESTAAFQPKQNTWCSLGLEAMTGPFSPSVTRPALFKLSTNSARKLEISRQTDLVLSKIKGQRL